MNHIITIIQVSYLPKTEPIDQGMELYTLTNGISHITESTSKSTNIPSDFSVYLSHLKANEQQISILCNGTAGWIQQAASQYSFHNTNIAVSHYH